MEYVFRMFVSSKFRLEPYRDDDYREDALHFTKSIQPMRLKKHVLKNVEMDRSTTKDWMIWWNHVVIH